MRSQPCVTSESRRLDNGVEPTKCRKAKSEQARSEASAPAPLLGASQVLESISEASRPRSESETEGGSAASAASPPSLSKSHNCDKWDKIVAGRDRAEVSSMNELGPTQPDLPFRLSGSQKKTAFALRQNCERLCKEAGIERVGFLTLTVGETNKETERFEQVFDAETASKRIHNLNRRVLSGLFSRAVVVTQRHKSGAIHFHVLGALRADVDIRTGFDFKAVNRGDYASVSPALLGIWKYLRETLPSYGFGRAELKPVEKCAEAISSYVARYIEKHLFDRRAEDYRKKLVRYIGWNKSQLKPNAFGWNTEGSAKWRTNARTLARLVTLEEPEQCRVIFGARWAYALSQVMPSLGSGRESYELCTELLLRDADRLTSSRTYLESRIECRRFELSRTRAAKPDLQRQLWN